MSSEAEPGARRRRLTWVVIAVAVTLTLLRFWDLRTAPFINDEPAFQLILDDHLAAHTLPTHTVTGTKGVVYGPTALWLYLPVRLFTDSVTLITAAHVLLHGLGLTLLFFAVRASVGTETAAWTWLLVAASPYLFFYARLPWDITFLVPLAALVLWCLSRLEKEAGRVGTWVGLGATFGLIFDLHLMALPVIGAGMVIAGLLLAQSWRRRRVWLGVAAGTVAMGATVFPYLREVASALAHGSQLALTTEALGHAVPETLRGVGRYLSADGMDYFLDDTNASVLQAIGPLRWGFALAWVVCLVGLAGVALATGVLARWLLHRRSAERRPSVVVGFGVAFFWILLFYYYAVRPYPFHPHYFMSAFWLLPFFAAWASSAVAWGAHRPRLLVWLGRGLRVTMAALALSNTAYVVAAHAAIARNRGTRGFHYSSVPAEIQSATAAICRAARQAGRVRAAVNLRLVPGVLPMPFVWFDHHLGECRGVDLSFPASGDARLPGDWPVTVLYGDDGPHDARLHLGMADAGL